MDLTANSQQAFNKTGNSAWLFQIDPRIYDLESALRVLSEIDCVVSMFADQIHAGDKVYLWKTGPNAALVAIASVLDQPSERKPRNADLLFYKSAYEAGSMTCRVSLQIDRVLERTIKQEEFSNDPVLKESLIAWQTSAGIRPLGHIEQQAIETLLGNETRRVAEEEEHIEPTGTRIITKSGDYVEPPLEEIVSEIRKSGLRIDERLIRRYHLALHSRGFVILAGLSGTGKTWLSKAYADAVSAHYELVCVAPNWNSNENLLGYVSPFKQNDYIDTPFSHFLRQASSAYLNAIEVGLRPKPFHVVLDEMNLARVEYYFALFLSKMEERARAGIARLKLGREEVLLPPNLFFIGTVNVDETTHGFSDKVYDRAQLIELEATEELIKQHIGNKPYAERLISVWRILHLVAPFTFRVVDDIVAYVDHAERVSASWEEAFDEQVTQKILPKVKGKDAATEASLRELASYCESSMPFTFKKIQSMLAAREKTGTISFFT